VRWEMGDKLPPPTETGFDRRAVYLPSPISHLVFSTLTIFRS